MSCVPQPERGQPRALKCSQPEPFCPLLASSQTDDSNLTTSSSVQTLSGLDESLLAPARRGCEYAWRLLVEGLYAKTLERLRRCCLRRWPGVWQQLEGAVADALIEQQGTFASSASVEEVASALFDCAVRILDRERRRDGRRDNRLKTFYMLNKIGAHPEPDDLARLKDLTARPAPHRSKPHSTTSGGSEQRDSGRQMPPVPSAEANESPGDSRKLQKSDEPRVKARKSPGVSTWTLAHGRSAEERSSMEQQIERVLSDADKQFLIALVSASEDFSCDDTEQARFGYKPLLEAMRKAPELALTLGFSKVPNNENALRVRMCRIRELLAADPDLKAPGGRN